MNGGSFESQSMQIGENVWSKDAILTLFQLYRDQRFLWDTKRSNYSKKMPKQRQYWQKNARKMLV